MCVLNRGYACAWACHGKCVCGTKSASTRLCVLACKLIRWSTHAIKYRYLRCLQMADEVSAFCLDMGYDSCELVTLYLPHSPASSFSVAEMKKGLRIKHLEIYSPERLWMWERKESWVR